MELSVNKEHEALGILRFTLALAIGFCFTQVWHMCPLESAYIENFLKFIAVGVFPYLVFKRKTYRWLFLVYGTLMLMAFYYIYHSALHRHMIPDFLITRKLHTEPQEYEILQYEDHYKVPDNKEKEYLEGHKYGWRLSSVKFAFEPNGAVLVINKKAVRDFFMQTNQKYYSTEELNSKSDAFKSGMKAGSKAATQDVKNYSEKLKRTQGN